MYVHCIYRFIQKQGLDRTFVECDNHMWRVDNRKLPGDITVDGGSDWIAIHRNYSRYLVTDQSDFLTGIKRYYEFSLLPAEVRRCLSPLRGYIAFPVTTCCLKRSLVTLSSTVQNTSANRLKAT